MDSVTGRASGARAARVQGLSVPAWAQEEATKFRPTIPRHAVTAVMYAEILGLQRARAQQILLKEVRDGTKSRGFDGTKHWYWPKETK